MHKMSDAIYFKKKNSILKQLSFFKEMVPTGYTDKDKIIGPPMKISFFKSVSKQSELFSKIHF